MVNVRSALCYFFFLSFTDHSTIYIYIYIYTLLSAFSDSMYPCTQHPKNSFPCSRWIPPHLLIKTQFVGDLVLSQLTPHIVQLEPFSIHFMARERAAAKGGGKATAAKVSTGKSCKAKAKDVKEVKESKRTKREEQKQRECKEMEPIEDPVQRAREAHARWQERIREPTRAEQKQAQDRRMAAWIKENPGKTKSHYRKHRKEQLDKMIAGIRSQTRFLHMKRSLIRRSAVKPG